MSKSNITDLIRQSREARPSAPSVASPVESETAGEAEEYPSYARLRGPQQVAFMLELRDAAGDSDVFDYGLLGRIRFDRSGSVVLLFANGTVTIRGKKLRPLLEGVITHRVTWVAVAANPAAESRDPEATVVTAIEVEVERS